MAALPRLRKNSLTLMAHADSLVGQSDHLYNTSFCLEEVYCKGSTRGSNSQFEVFNTYILHRAMRLLLRGAPLLRWAISGL